MTKSLLRWTLISMLELSAGVVLTGYLASQAQSEDMSNTNSWKTYSMPEYGLRFLYPENAVVGELADGLPGATWIDGLNKMPLGVHLMPVYSTELIAGVRYDFNVRFLMLTEAAKLHKLTAKNYGWTERPKQPPFPFDFKRDLGRLQEAVERLFVLCSLEKVADVKRRIEIKPVRIDGYSGAKFSFWRPVLSGLKEEFFEEIAAVPISSKETLLIQAGYYKIRDADDLRLRQELYSKITASVHFERAKGEKGNP